MQDMRGTGLFVTAVAMTLMGAALALGATGDKNLKDRIFERLLAQDNQAAAELLERHID